MRKACGIVITFYDYLNQRLASELAHEIRRLHQRVSLVCISRVDDAVNMRLRRATRIGLCGSKLRYDPVEAVIYSHWMAASVSSRSCETNRRSSLRSRGEWHCHALRQSLELQREIEQDVGANQSTTCGSPSRNAAIRSVAMALKMIAKGRVFRPGLPQSVDGSVDGKRCLKRCSVCYLRRAI
jgi:hypothetical protein